SRYRVRKNKMLRRQRRRRKGRLRALGLLAAKGVLSLATVASVALLGFMTYRYVQQSGRLNVGEVRVMGCMNILESELLEIAKVDFRSSLVQLDLQDISRRIARHPWVEKAQVRRDLSRKALVIEVKERVPRALILLDDLYLVDRNGEAFKKAEAKERTELPILTGVSAKEWKKKDAETAELVRQAFAVLDILEGRKVFPMGEVSEVHLSRKDGLTLYTLNGALPVRLGTGEYEDKLNRLEKVLPDLRPKLKNVEYLALTVPNKLVVKMKETAPEKAKKS
ncbi:MAG TPA: cell division protein FtsQ/DivIB, partial [Thermodesulfobacteriota bacterium]|nr:cell division protein FtsQ/DivIB [Thermodesulfobacteriota bacterium]